jgi:hypothetical protein
MKVINEYKCARVHLHSLRWWMHCCHGSHYPWEAVGRSERKHTNGFEEFLLGSFLLAVLLAVLLVVLLLVVFLLVVFHDA